MDAPGKTGTDWKPRHNELDEIRKKAADDAKKEREKTQASAATASAVPSPPAAAPPAAASRPVVSLSFTSTSGAYRCTNDKCHTDSSVCSQLLRQHPHSIDQAYQLRKPASSEKSRNKLTKHLHRS
jgi:hypothetical protein